MFTFSVIWDRSVQLLFGNRAALNPGLCEVRDVASTIISHEQIQSNRVCCLQTLDGVFPKDMSRDMTKSTLWLCVQRRLRSVWSESSLCAQWVAKDLSFIHADSEDSDQTGWMPRMIWVIAGRTCYFVGFVTRRLICFQQFLVCD